MSEAVWLRLQVRYDLESAQASLGQRIEQEVKVFNEAVPASRSGGLTIAST